MDVNETLVIWSDRSVLAAVVLYVLAVLAYAAELAARSKTRSKVDAGAGRTADSGATIMAAEEPGERGSAAGGLAVALTVTGCAANVGALLTRGLGVGRWPWGNMYEFVVAICAAAVTVFLVLMARWRIRRLGLFVLLPAVLGLGVAVRYLYVDAGPVDPILNTYWVAIHVTAAILASGIFIVSAVAAVLYLMKARGAAIADRLPSLEDLDRVMHRAIVFAFPLWTFAVAAGAIWAAHAWGRYWGWDPKEVWSFITWIAYAAYLHARATAGWKGSRAAVVSLIAFAALMFNLFGVNIFISGLHSYSGLD